MKMPVGDRSQAGFTLLEMLVVLAILALVTTVAMPLLHRPSDTVRLKSTAQEFVAALRATRAAAILHNSEATLVIDVSERKFASPVVSPRFIPKDIATTLVFAASEQSVASQAGFRFFPDGSATGGDIVLALRERQTKICIDWLTGIARQEPCR
jgi:general secretion pathway protein H